MTAVLELRIIWTHEERGEMEMDLKRKDKKIQLRRPTCCVLLSKTDKGKKTISAQIKCYFESYDW